MRARYLGPNSDLLRVRGSKHNTGEVLQAMLAIGAKAAGHWQGAHMTPIDSAAPAVETPLLEGGKGNSMNRYDYPYGITVNSLGLRFYDEGEAKHSYTYAKTGRAVLAQPGGAAFQIYDQTGVELFRRGPNYKATMFEATTIAELAQKIGIEPAVLVHTVEEFNAACRTRCAARSACRSMANAPSASRRRNRIGPSRSGAHRSAPIRSLPVLPSLSGACRWIPRLR